jgi:hypothetical protein
MPRVLRILVPAVLAALVLAGCNGKTGYNTSADDEGLPINVGKLVYQVQLSRYLNPNDVEDSQYLKGLPPGTVQTGGGDTWFGIFMRVDNYSKQTQTPTTQFTITDTLGNTYRPIAQNTAVNGFAYTGKPLPPGFTEPDQESPAYNGPIQGALILFRLKIATIQNRPLLLHILNGSGQQGTISLDL